MDFEREFLTKTEYPVKKVMVVKFTFDGSILGETWIGSRNLNVLMCSSKVILYKLKSGKVEY